MYRLSLLDWPPASLQYGIARCWRLRHGVALGQLDHLVGARAYDKGLEFRQESGKTAAWTAVVAALDVGAAVTCVVWVPK